MIDYAQNTQSHHVRVEFFVSIIILMNKNPKYNVKNENRTAKEEREEEE